MISDRLIRAWVEAQCRQSLRAQRVAEVLFCVVVAILGAAMLVHWLTPCAKGTLC